MKNQSNVGSFIKKKKKWWTAALDLQAQASSSLPAQSEMADSQSKPVAAEVEHFRQKGDTELFSKQDCTEKLFGMEIGSHLLLLKRIKVKADELSIC